MTPDQLAAHQQRMFADRLRTHQDHRLMTVLGCSSEQIGQLSTIERSVLLATADSQEAAAQERQRRMFADDERRRRHDKTPVYFPAERRWGWA